MRAPRPFFYQAAKPGGGRAWGFKRARDERHLGEQLRRERLVPLRSWAMPNLGGGGSPSESPLKDQAELHTQLAQLLSRGVPLVEALEVCAQAVSSRMRPRVEKIRELVAAGSSFADACSAVGGFDPVTVAVYRAAERTGDLAGAAGQLSLTLRRQLAVRGKAATLMLYPAVVLTLSVLASGAMLTIVVPGIIESLKDATEATLPAFTEAVYATGVFIRDHLAIIAGVIGTLLIAAFLMRDAVGAVLARAMRRIPGVRSVVLAQECARFFTVMSAMTRTGVVLADALGVGVGAISHPVLRRELTRLRTRLIEGGVLRYLIDEVTTFPLPTRRLLIAAERSGDLQQAFDTLSADMADEVDRRSTRLLALLEPMLIVLMFVLIGSLVLSVMIPMISLISQIQAR